jgi:D-serine deaminase-like pyridoxal phosphate-dependent protein
MPICIRQFRSSDEHGTLTLIAAFFKLGTVAWVAPVPLALVVCGWTILTVVDGDDTIGLFCRIDRI